MTMKEAVDVRQLFLTLWEGRHVIVLVTGVVSVAAVLYALLATQIYRAEALVQPRSEGPADSGLAVLTAQFGGLASLAGLPVGVTGDRAVAVATLKSRVVIESMIRDNNLLPKLYEAAWDSEAKAWRSTDAKTIPTTWQAYNDFTRSLLKLTEDRKSGLLTVAIEWKDPHEAQRWVTDLIARTNAHLKTLAIEDGERNLTYLQRQSESIGQVELRQALFGLVEAEMKKLMVAKGSAEFALKTIDPAAVPQRRIRPKRTAIAAAGVLLGGFLGVFVVLSRKAWREMGSDAA